MKPAALGCVQIGTFAAPPEREDFSSPLCYEWSRLTVRVFSLKHLRIGSYFFFDIENLAVFEQLAVVWLGFEIVFDGTGEKLHIHVVLIPDQIADTSLPVIDLNHSTLGRSYFRHSKLIDFPLHIMTPKIGNIFFKKIDICSSGQGNIVYVGYSVR